MASSKERLRWDRMFSAQTQRMERQRSSLTRLLALFTEANTALLEIANTRPGLDWTAEDAARRAQEALERIAEPAAAIGPAVEESDRQFDADMKEAKDG